MSDSKILIFGGTTEGRVLAEKLAEKKISCDVCVATDYGKNVLCPNDYINIQTGRLTSEQMLSLYSQKSYSVIVDVTHPYATEVSKNIRQSVEAYNKSADKTKLELLRLERNTCAASSEDGVFYFENDIECEKTLENELADKEQNILLTTGSKDLGIFCQNELLRKHIFARVIPSVESLEICQKNGLEGRQIIAMQGPFSCQMNLAQIIDNNIGILVTKESGVTGGFDTKIEAVRESGIKCFVVKKPDGANTVPQNNSSYSEVSENIKIFTELDELLSCIKDLLHLPQEHHSVILTGIGMGSADLMTCEVQHAIKNADYLFGAERILSSAKKLNQKAKAMPYYLAKDIVPVLQKITSAPDEGKNSSSVILFSGDTGFFSGAEKLIAELKKLSKISVKVMPGISSMQYLFARCGLSWQNTTVLNLHGVQKEDWVDKLSKIVYKSRQIFFITSSNSDVQELGTELLRLSSFGNVDFKILLGYQLSYPEETIKPLTPKDCQTVFKPGLYSGIIQIIQK